MAPGCFAKKIKIAGVAKINKTAPVLAGDSGSSSIISRKRKPIREAQGHLSVRESGWTQL